MAIVALPEVASPTVWNAAREKLLVKEKEMTRALDALAAERRRLPMVRIDRKYEFLGSHGKTTLIDLFHGRRQLLIYHFMFAPGSEPCTGCSSFTDNVGRLEHLNARDTFLALVSRAPISEIEQFRKRMSWDLPWYSSNASNFNQDFGVTAENGESNALSAFLRDNEDVYLTYRTQLRGVDRLRMDFNLLDLTAYGRQEQWEDSPPGWPQTPPYTWWRKHDEYGK